VGMDHETDDGQMLALQRTLLAPGAPRRDASTTHRCVTTLLAS
jgi:hypothetical protein